MQPRILIPRTPPLRPHDWDQVLYWVKQEHPSLIPLIDVCAMPYTLPAEATYKVMVNWLQDPLENLDPPAFHQALALEAECDRRGIPVINRVSRHANLAKSETSRRLNAVGIRAAIIHKFGSHEEFLEEFPKLPYPVIVREDISHGRPMFLIRTFEEARAVQWNAFFRPIVSEFVDIRNEDGFIRRYRGVTVGDDYVSAHNLQVSEYWETRKRTRVRNLATREEELAYVTQPDPRADVLLKARKALDVEFLAFDYGIDHEGQVVVWEANQHPELIHARDDLAYRNFADYRLFAAMFRYYLTLAGVEVPAKMHRQASVEA
jgi:hypothetical protein